jgi:hypothetical protein
MAGYLNGLPIFGWFLQYFGGGLVTLIWERAWDI